MSLLNENSDEDVWQQITDGIRVAVVLLGIGAACIGGLVWIVLDLGRNDVQAVNAAVDKQTCGSCRLQPKEPAK